MDSNGIIKIADNIISPMGFNSGENMDNVLLGRSALRQHRLWNIPEPFIASLFESEELQELCNRELSPATAMTRFERLATISAKKAIEESGIDPSSPRVIFIISTTKGNVELLGETQLEIPQERITPAISAKVIAGYFGNPNTPVVVSNACTSGACAQLLAARLLNNGYYDYAVVTGAEVQSKFIISGFQSFKALSPEECRPFDKERQGLNAGEGAGTIIYRKAFPQEGTTGAWTLISGAINNDANHISGPSRTGEGSFKALMETIKGFDTNKIAFINAHGTATLYNDEMESIAITRAGLNHIPVNGLKGYYGHTMGAAGIIETIISQRAIEKGIIPATRGFNEPGVSGEIIVSDTSMSTDKKAFLKLLSGFGGCNVALLFKKQEERV